jgi:hypothetical protein
MSTSVPLCDLPQENERWQGDVMNVGDDQHPLWLAWVTCPDWDLILASATSEQEPGASWLWDTLVRAVESPPHGPAHRPTMLLVRPGQLWEALKSELAKVGIALVVTDALYPVDGVPEMLDELFAEWQKKYGELP